MDPQFREQFEIANPSKRYLKVLAAVPHVVVLSEERLLNLVNLLSHEIQQSFQVRGLHCSRRFLLVLLLPFYHSLLQYVSFCIASFWHPKALPEAVVSTNACIVCAKKDDNSSLHMRTPISDHDVQRWVPGDWIHFAPLEAVCQHDVQVATSTL